MKLKHLDSIRGIAILMVILVHTSQNVPFHQHDLLFFINYGQFGVQLFFVASAYTLCISSENRKYEKNKNLKYAIRRYFRIAPAYYIGILIYFIIRTMINKIITGSFTIPAQYSSLNVLSNIAFFHGFYEPGNNTIVPGGWSIGTEMAFYIIFPSLFKIATKTITSFKNLVVFLIIGILVCFAIIFILYLNGFLVTESYFLYFNLLNQLPVFLIGISYYFYKEKLKMDWNHKFDIFFFILLTIFSFIVIYIKLNFVFPITIAFSFLFLIEIFRRYDHLNPKLLVKIGQVSFSMYLLHFIFATYITSFLSAKVDFGSGFLSLVFYYMFSVIATFICALYSEKMIEKPGMELGRFLIKKIK